MFSYLAQFRFILDPRVLGEKFTLLGQNLTLSLDHGTNWEFRPNRYIRVRIKEKGYKIMVRVKMRTVGTKCDRGLRLGLKIQG